MLMRKIRIGKDIHFTWQILTNGEPIPLDGRDLKLMLKNPLRKNIGLPFSISQGNRLRFIYHGTDHTNLAYIVLLCGKITVRKDRRQ